MCRAVEKIRFGHGFLGRNFDHKSTSETRHPEINRQRCGRDDLKTSVLSGPVLVCINDSFPNGEFRTSICDRNCTPKKTWPKRIFSATLHVAVFNENSTDRKLTLSPIDPFQSRQKRRCRDLYTTRPKPCFSPFFQWIILCFC